MRLTLSGVFRATWRNSPGTSGPMVYTGKWVAITKQIFKKNTLTPNSVLFMSATPTVVMV